MRTKIKELIFFGFFAMISITGLAFNFTKIIEKIGQGIEMKNENHFLSDSQTAISIEDSIYEDTMIEPHFPGGNEALFKWIQTNLVYPQISKVKGEEGVLYVKFTVDSIGKIKDIEIRKGIYESLDKEAIRLVSIMPDWIPGSVYGKPANISMTLPIRFELD
jgi:protein TonB